MIKQIAKRQQPFLHQESRVIRYGKKIIHLFSCAVTMTLAGIIFLPKVSGAVHSPSLDGRPSELNLRPAQAQLISRAITATLRRQHALLNDPVSLAYLQQLGNRLKKAQIIQDDTPYRFYLIKNDNINAFATPGGAIFLFTGLVTSANTPDQLAGVMAHEMAHVSQRHIARMMSQQRQNMIPTLLGAAAAVAAAASGHGDAALGALAIGQSNSIWQQLHYSRQMEQEADHMAVKTVRRAGMNPHGIGEFLSILQQRSLAYGQHPKNRSTHPELSSRISDAEQRVGHPPRSSNHNPMFDLIQTRIRAETPRQPYALQQDWQQQAHQQPAARYGLALLNMKQNPVKAQQQLKLLITQSPHQWLFYYDLATLQQAQHQDAKALKTLKQAPQNKQWHYPMGLALVESLRGQHRNREALSALLPVCQQRPSPSCYQQLAQLHALDRQLALAFFYQAKSLAEAMDFQSAQRQIKLGLAQHPIDQKVQQRLQQLQQNLQQQQQLWRALR